VSTTTTVQATVTDGSTNAATCNFEVTIEDTEDPVIDTPPAITAANTDPDQAYATDGVGDFLPDIQATDAQSDPANPSEAPTVVAFIGACETSDGTAVAGNDETVCTSATSVIATGYTWEAGACAYTNDPTHAATPEGGETECIERDDMFWTPARCLDLDGTTLVDAATQEDCTTQETNNVWVPLKDVVTASTQFAIGDTVVTFVAADNADDLAGVDTPNSVQATTVVTVTDNQDPVIPSGRCVDVTVGTDSGKNFATVAVALDGGDDIVPERYGDDNSGESLLAVATLAGNPVNANRWDGAACTDPSGGAVVAASESDCMTQFVLGANTVTYTATDAAGNTGTCTFDVTVVDQEVPTIDCASLGAGISGSTDPVDGATGRAYGSTAFDVLPEACAATSAGTDDAACSSVVLDGTEATCTGAGACTYTAPGEYASMVKSDNSVAEGDLVVTTFVNRCVATAGSLADCQAIADGYTWDSLAGTCTEVASGNVVDSSFCYHDEGLQWYATTGRLSTGTDGVCLQLARDDQATCESDSHLPSPSWEWVEVTALTRFPIGDTELAVIVADGINVAHTIGGTDACTITLTIADDEIPTISCGTDPTGTTDAGESFGTISAGSVTLPAATATDNDAATVAYETAPTCSEPACSGHLCQVADCTGVWYAGGEVISDDYPFPYTGTSGSDTTTVVYVATDGAGNEDRCSITVTVNDNEAPAIECPAAISIEADVADSWVATCGPGGETCATGEEPGSARIYGHATLPELTAIADNSGETSALVVTVGTLDPSGAIDSALGGVTYLDAETTVGSGVYSLPAQFDLDVFVSGDTRTVGATRTYNMQYSATDSSGNPVTCTTIVTVVERDDCQDSPCQNGGLCTDTIADSFGYYEDGGLRMRYDSEVYDGSIVRVGSEEIIAFSEWAAYVTANSAASLGANSDPGYQCSCVRGWEGETCAQDVNECGFRSPTGSVGDEGAYHCQNTANMPCSGPCENGAVCTDSSTSGSTVPINSYACGCEGGFSGPNCEVLDECNPPGGINPCELSSVALPSAGAFSTGLLPSDKQFLCPVNMVCTDPDHTTTDDYICSCPSCNDAVFSESEVQELQVFFEEHLPYRRAIATLVVRQGDPNEICEVPDLAGCTDPTAVNFDAAAVVDDASCIAAVEGCMDATATNYDATATVYTFTTHGDGALQCKQTDTATDECATNPCNSADHRLCQQEVGEPGVPCGDARQAFHCDARFTGGNTQRFGEDFTCTDPNPYWEGDYVCTCEYDTEDGDYADTYVHSATCGVDNAATADVENVLFENPYRPIADVPAKIDEPICIGTATNAFTGCVFTAARPEHGRPETCIPAGYTEFGCALTPGVDCSVDPQTGLPNGCRYIQEVTPVAEACVTAAAVAGTTFTDDTSRCTLDPSTDFGATAGTCIPAGSYDVTCAYVAGEYSGTLDTVDTADSCTSTLADGVTVTTTDTTNCALASGDSSFGVSPGSCSDLDSAVATCVYVAGAYSASTLDTIDTADSCTSTLLSVPECAAEDVTGDDAAADRSACEGVTAGGPGVTNPCTYIEEVVAVPEQCTAPTCQYDSTLGNADQVRESCEGQICADIFQAYLNAGVGADTAQSGCVAAGCDYYEDECASLGKKMCPGDGACVDMEFLCVITNYELTQLVKEDDEMFSFIMTRQRRPIHERVPTAEEFATWCPTEWAACDADATCSTEILALLATPPTQAALDSAGALAQALASCAISAVETEYGALGDWANGAGR
jgi:hypothetical protein